MALGKLRGSVPAPVGGVNNTDNIFSIDRDQVYRAINMRLNQDGVFETRRGSNRLNSTAAASGELITSIYDYRRPDGSGRTRHILVTAGKYLYEFDEDTNTVTQLRELLTDERPSWITFGNAVGGSVAIMANGTDFLSFNGFKVEDITFAESVPELGAEFLASTGWTSTNWTGSWTVGWSHTVDQSTALSSSTAAVASTKYYIDYTVSGRTDGSFTIAFGGKSKTGVEATGVFQPTTSTTDGLVITPSTKFNGTIIISIKVVTLTTHVSAPRYLYVYDDRALATGSNTYPYRIYASQTFDGTTWTYGDPYIGHYWLMDGASGDRVTGLGSMYSFGVIFQQFGVTIITGSDPADLANKQIGVAKKYGTTSHWSIQTVGNIIYFADETHINRGVLRDAVENGMMVEPISDNIDREYRNVKTTSDIVSVYDSEFEEIQWACDIGAASRKKNRIFAYSIRNSGMTSDGLFRNVWCGWYNGFTPHTLAVVLDSNDKPVIWRGDNVGFIYKMYEPTQYQDVGSDGNDDYITTEIVTAPYYPYGVMRTKRLRMVTPLAFQRFDSALEAQWIVDGSYIKPSSARAITLYNRVPMWRDSTDTQRAQEWSTTVWNARPYIIRPVTVNEPFRYVQFRLTSDGTNAQDETAYAGLEVAYQVHGMKHPQG